MLSCGGGELYRVAREAFDSAMASVATEGLVTGTVVAPEHGLFAPAALGALREKAAREIVGPCARGLLAARGGVGTGLGVIEQELTIRSTGREMRHDPPSGRGLS